LEALMPGGFEGRFERLRAASVEVAIDARGGGLPRILHWGPDLGDLTDGDLDRLATAAVPPVTSYVLDDPVPVAVLPEHALGYAGFPGVCGHRDDGSGWSPLFTITDIRRQDGSDSAEVVFEAADDTAMLRLHVAVEMLPSGLVRLRARLTNTSASEPYRVESLTVTLPVPPEADELLDLTGRHSRERSPQRQPFHVGTRLRDSRRGHGGHDASLLLIAGTAGFGFRGGEVWGVHLAWSGNYRVYAERLPTGAAALVGGGELLLPGEVRLGPGESYETPWLYGSYAAHGMDEMSERFHRYIRSRPQHPPASRPRPALINTWEAVYFDTDTDKLLKLADQAAAVGVERFVLDDGWFRGRRGEAAGLGDWYVDLDVWPDGLHPLVDHVRGLGMEFGLWFEPECVSPGSELARHHPDWLMSTGGRLPPLSRLQHVLDLGNADAWNYLLERIDSLLTEYDVGFVKWDINRDIVDGGHLPVGEPGVHRQTIALFELLDELKRRHPGVEIESCAGGGGRVDLAILERTDRIWASDNNDALDRQLIQRWTGLLLPPELVGAHVGAEHAHSTGRTHTTAFRAGTALFGHFGVELDLTTMRAEQRGELAEWLALYKRVRPLIHSGRVVRSDLPDPSLLLHGVVAQDGGEALYALVGMTSPVTQPPGRIRLPGLDQSRRYRLRLLKPGHVPIQTRRLPPWLAAADPDGPGLELPGSTLATAGIQAPFMRPESLLLLHLEAAT
jgi:alpha-galactosidase